MQNYLNTFALSRSEGWSAPYLENDNDEVPDNIQSL